MYESFMKNIIRGLIKESIIFDGINRGRSFAEQKIFLNLR